MQVLASSYFYEGFGFGEETKSGVATRFGPKRYHFFELLQAIAQMCSSNITNRISQLWLIVCPKIYSTY